MNNDETLIRRLVAGDTTIVTTTLARPETEQTPTTLLVAALVAAAPGDLLVRASRLARSTRERQLVAIADAHLSGDDARLGALVRDHLVDHPDSLLAAWIATQHTTPSAATGGIDQQE